MPVPQSCEAGTKGTQPTVFSRRRRERGGAEEQPFSHGDTERKIQVKITNSQLLAEEQQKTKSRFLSILRASVREWLLKISFCHKKKLKISVQGISPEAEKSYATSLAPPTFDN
jgi:hypothetical protein